MHWLSTREQNWPLIMDNADHPEIQLEDYFPNGDRGHIRVTTRNPEYKIYGNVGCQFFAFNGLDLDDATVLLLKAAEIPGPWDDNSKETAMGITHVLGHLPLAITHAGRAVSGGLSSL
jgi:hypothetical protein